MKKDEIRVGATYVAKVSGALTVVRITGMSPYGGWTAINLKTKHVVRILTAARLRRPWEGPSSKMQEVGAELKEAGLGELLPGKR